MPAPPRPPAKPAAPKPPPAHPILHAARTAGKAVAHLADEHKAAIDKHLQAIAEKHHAALHEAKARHEKHHRAVRERIENATVISYAPNRTAIAPTLTIGMSQHHLGFAGSVTLRPSTLIAVVHDVVTSLMKHGFERFLFINGHGGNVATVTAAFDEIYAAASMRAQDEPPPVRCKMLVWYEPHQMMVEAIRREKALKHWLRSWKLELIERMNPDWQDLYETLNQ